MQCLLHRFTFFLNSSLTLIYRAVLLAPTSERGVAGGAVSLYSYLHGIYVRFVGLFRESSTAKERGGTDPKGLGRRERLFPINYILKTYCSITSLPKSVTALFGQELMHR